MLHWPQSLLVTGRVEGRSHLAMPSRHRGVKPKWRSLVRTKIDALRAGGGWQSWQVRLDRTLYQYASLLPLSTRPEPGGGTDTHMIS